MRAMALLLLMAAPLQGRVITEEIVLACSGIPCDGPPENIWSEPDCADYHTDSALIENAQRGDNSAIALLRERHRTATTHQQRTRIAAALLGRVPDDRALWRELEEHAQTAVRFAEMTEDEREAAFAAWAAERQVEPYLYEPFLHLAFQHASEDARAVPLLLRALGANDTSMVSDAIYALARRRDERHFGAIRKALDRHVEEHPWLVTLLACFQSDAADRLAAEYLLDDSAREEYATQREAVAVSTP